MILYSLDLHPSGVCHNLPLLAENEPALLIQQAWSSNWKAPGAATFTPDLTGRSSYYYSGLPERRLSIDINYLSLPRGLYCFLLVFLTPSSLLDVSLPIYILDAGSQFFLDGYDLTSGSCCYYRPG